MPCAITLALANTLHSIQGNPLYIWHLRQAIKRTHTLIDARYISQIRNSDTFSSQSHRATHDYKVYFSMSSVAHPL